MILLVQYTEDVVVDVPGIEHLHEGEPLIHACVLGSDGYPLPVSSSHAPLSYLPASFFVLANDCKRAEEL